MKPAIYTTDSSFFAAPDLAEFINADLYVDHKVGLYKNPNVVENIVGVEINNNIKIRGININTDHLIVINTIALKQISFLIEQKKFKKVTLIVCDSNSTKTYKWWNDFVKKHNISVYVMPDLVPYCKGIEYKPIYHFMKINDNNINKNNDILLIGHGPSTLQKAKIKGSKQIENIINKLKSKYNNVDYIQIIGKKHGEGLKLKKQCHIFIDQLIYNNPYIDITKHWDKIIPYKGGLGKSGLEAMHLKCCTLTGGLKYNTEPYFESPPIIWIDYNNIENELIKLLNNKNKINEIANNQYNWIKNYSTSKFAKNYLGVN